MTNTLHIAIHVSEEDVNSLYIDKKVKVSQMACYCI